MSTRDRTAGGQILEATVARGWWTGGVVNHQGRGGLKQSAEAGESREVSGRRDVIAAAVRPSSWQPPRHQFPHDM